MKHNLCSKLFFSILLILSVSHTALAKVMNTEFLNQASFGSEGPQLQEIQSKGVRSYLLTFNIPGKNPLLKVLTKKQYQRLQSEMRAFVKEASSDQGNCDRVISYTQVEEEKKIRNANICWENLPAEKRLRISDWFIEIQKSLL